MLIELSPAVLDVFRWIAMAWLLVCIAWVVQLAVLSRMFGVSLLAAGLSISLFLDIGFVYNRFGQPNFSTIGLPLIYVLSALISAGMYFFVRIRPDVHFVRPFFILLKINRDLHPRRSDRDG